MLAGLQDQVATLFPAIRNLTPDEEDLKDGANKLKFGRVVEISGYHTEIYDMHLPKDRSAYNKKMLDLSKMAQIGTVRILVHDRQMMQRKDGSTGWYSYLEWMEYSRKDDLKRDKKEKTNG